MPGATRPKSLVLCADQSQLSHHCQAAELTFASVHDSYWTHACDIDTMSDIIRDTFVRLHSEDILVKLREEVSRASD